MPTRLPFPEDLPKHGHPKLAYKALPGTPKRHAAKAPTMMLIRRKIEGQNEPALTPVEAGHYIVTDNTGQTIGTLTPDQHKQATSS